MRKDTGQVFRIEDYRPCDYTIPRTRLTFALDARETLVTAELEMARRDDVAPGTPLVLDGDELDLVSLAIDGKAADEAAFEAGPQGLTLSRPPRGKTFRLTVVTRLDPARNGALMGLYRSNGVWCTQCEPEGFRRITYFLDRPDMLSVYTVRIEASRKQAPVLLSNGNPVEAGALPGGNGLVFDWSLIAGHRPDMPWMLSGGLTAENVAEAIRITGAEAVDVSSGVETAPGQKSPELIEAFIRAAKAA